MPKSDLCPVCTTEMTEYHDMIDVYNGMGPTSEHYLTCPKGCYSFEYAYGATRIRVALHGHHAEFGWSYSDDPQTVRNESDAIDVTCEVARIIYREDQAQRPQESR